MIPTMKSLSAFLLLMLGHSSTVVSPFFGHSFRLGNVSNRNGRRLGLDGGAALVGMVVPPRRSPSPSSSPSSSSYSSVRMTASSDDRSSNNDDDVVVAVPLPRRTAAAAVERRQFLREVAALSLLPPSLSAALLLVSPPPPSHAAEAVFDPPQLPPKITHKVRMDVRISRADGSFYVRDAPPASSSSSSSSSVDDDDPFYGTLVLGLFGDVAPNHVMRFLGYVDVPYDVDAPLPSYSRSKFDTLDASTGLLIGGTVSSVLSRIRDDAKNYNRGQDIILFSSLSSLRASFISFTHRLSSPYRDLRKIGGG